jgi:hypothetical protein
MAKPRQQQALLRGRKFSRKDAAAYIEERLGVPFSYQTLRAKPVPFVLLNHRAVYTQADLDAAVETMLNGAVRRIGDKRSTTPRSSQPAPAP